MLRNNPQDLLGKWVKQYQKGIWKVICIKPKYAIDDYSDGSLSWRKGDIIGSWALLKKAFSSSFRFSMSSGYCDINCCSLVTNDELEMIEDYFLKHKQQEKLFNEYPFNPALSIYNVWIDVPDSLQDEIENMINGIIPFISKEELLMTLEQLGVVISKPPSTHLLNLFFLPWNIDEKGNIVVTKAEIVPFYG